MERNAKYIVILIFINLNVFRTVRSGSSWRERDLGYGDICRGAADKCDRSKYLICLDGLCQCTNPETMTYNETSGTCVVNLLNSCYQEEYYTRQVWVPVRMSSDKNVGSRTVKFTRKLPCVSGAICKMGHCVSTNSTTTTAADSDEETRIPEVNLKQNTNSDDSQQYGYDSPCNNKENNQCPRGTGLECTDGKCKCKIENQQYFNGTRCVSIVNGPCGTLFPGTANEISIDCTPFASCVPENKHSVCRCLPDYLAATNGKCLSGYNASCDWEGQRCKAGVSLKCINGKCGCGEILHTYDENAKRCRGLVGAACTYVPDGISFEGVMEIRNFCVDGAVCDRKAEVNDLTAQGFCKCSSASSETDVRTCGH